MREDKELVSKQKFKQYHTVTTEEHPLLCGPRE